LAPATRFLPRYGKYLSEKETGDKVNWLWLVLDDVCFKSKMFR